MAQLCTASLAALVLAVAMIAAPGGGAPDSDDAARAAATIGVWSDICGSDDPDHSNCPFCTLNGTSQKAVPGGVANAGFLLQLRAGGEDVVDATLVALSDDPARAPPALV